MLALVGVARISQWPAMERRCTMPAEWGVGGRREGRAVYLNGCDQDGCQRSVTLPACPHALCSRGGRPDASSSDGSRSEEGGDSGRRLHKSRGLRASAEAERNCYRQRFYFVRHSQSQNNAINVNDQTPATCEPEGPDDGSEESPPPGVGVARLPGLPNERKGQGRISQQSEAGTPVFRKALRSQGSHDEPSAGPVSDGTGGQQQFGRVPDPPITAVGRAQAATAARWIEKYVHHISSRPAAKQLSRSQGLPPPPHVKKIVCSPMRRAVETAAELNKVLPILRACLQGNHATLDAALLSSTKS